MPSDIIAITSPTIVHIPDGVIETDYEGSEVVLILGHCSGSSIRGITVKRRGKVRRVYVRPDLDREISLFEGEQQLFLLILESKKKDEVSLHYSAESRKWEVRRCKE